MILHGFVRVTIKVRNSCVDFKKGIVICMYNLELKGKTIFVTGAAGFIGSNLCKALLKDEDIKLIVGIDNMNDYYDVNLKEYRLKELVS